VKPEDQQLTERDKQLRDSFTHAELQLCVHLLITSTVAFWLADPRSFWGLGFFMIGGGLSIFILKTHEQTHPFLLDLLWPKFWLYSAPIWWLLLQQLVGLFQSPLEPIMANKDLFTTLGDINQWLPATTASGTTWIGILGFTALYLSALNLYLIPKSRAFFERVMPCLCLSAVVVCIFGYLQEAINLRAPLFTKGTGQTDFFSFFPYDGHWAAFALIWASVCTGLGLLSTRYDDSPDFINSISPWYLTGAALLGASGFIVQARWPSTILLIGYSGMLLLVAASYIADNRDRHSTTIATTSGLLACAFFTSGIVRATQPDSLSDSSQALHRAAIEMFKDSPIFGWGMDSFHLLAPFYQDDNLLGARYDRAHSDFFQFLAEFGLIGTVVPALILALLLLNYIRKKSDVRTTNHMLIGCAGVLIMAFFDTPFMSPAVFFSFLVVLFSASRWADLSRNRVDEVDTRRRLNLVTPEAERRVPYFTGKYNTKER